MPKSTINAAAELAAKSSKGKTADLIGRFVAAFWGSAPPDDVKARDAKELSAAASAHWKLGRSKPLGKHKISIHHDKKHDVATAMLVIDDMPFLVDSLTNTLNQVGLSIALTVHPVLWVQRDSKGAIAALEGSAVEGDEAGKFAPEAWLRFEFDSPINEQALTGLEKRIEELLADIRGVVDCWQPMRSKAAEIRFQLERPHLPIDDAERAQVSAFLEWIEDNNFTFISYVRARLAEGKEGRPDLRRLTKSRLGLKIDASPWLDLKEGKRSPKVLRQYLDSSALLVITKANQLAPIHRNAYLDYIAIKDYDDAGVLQGEHRFFGLFTRGAYASRALDIPLLKTKITQAAQRASLDPASHDGKLLLNTLETFPRDELFQSTVDELYDIGSGVLDLQERQRVKMFCRIDTFRRFYSFLIYLPRDRYSQHVREQIQAMLTERLGGRDSEFSIRFAESVLARLHLIIRVGPGKAKKPDMEALTDEVNRITRNWSDGLREALLEKHSRRAALDLQARYAKCFPADYTGDTSPECACQDIEELEALDETGRSVRARLFTDQSGELHLRCVFTQEPLALAASQPRLDNMGLSLITEDLYELNLCDGRTRWLQDYRLKYLLGGELDVADSRARAEEAFTRIYTGAAEDDWFNRLVLAAGLSWREAAVIRAYARYLKQLGVRFGQIYLSQILSSNGHITAKLFELFATRFDPDLKGNRKAKQEKISKAIDALLDEVSSLDADRILRTFRSLIMATLRTNYYQLDEHGEPKPWITFKLSTRDLADAPSPKPMYEIWLWSPRVEAVHLRGGKVARGGLRWSDRPEDFRTEILGLVKAQMVKNTVIVPVGAKGGFVCKQMPDNPSRDERLEEGIACYRTFMRGMLQITDNLDGDKIVPPPRVVRHDDDDPYLVVAADKGTATFSDIANEEAANHDFWIDDAFASGGSNGYDHKKMGITARGAWESVKRHFRELGKDIQNDEFTVVAVGDMGGDVFGNGMLLSKHIRLLAAFNHRHIFLDPTPDAAKTWKERERLFNNVAGWDQYNKKLISKGGGIYERSAKTIEPSAAACDVLQLEKRSYSPDELMQALLKSPVDLFWNGGIGTYAKAREESHEDVGDRANDAIRVDGREMGAKVIGEGGNLGVTQLGRVEFALHGGRCNADFIDNSGGVDSSDAEVNIKILLGDAVRRKQLTMKRRNTLLASMTDSVANAVLRDNYLQSQSISLMAESASERLGEGAELIRMLERDADLDRGLEYLPDEDTIKQRRSIGQGLTRPELAVLLCYAKMDVYDELVDSDVPEDPWLSRELEKFFPKKLHKDYDAHMRRHRLKREIIATRITNSMINRMGAAFAHRTREDSGHSISHIARAYTIAKEVFRVGSLWWEIEQLDNKIPAASQLRMMVSSNRLIKHVALWLLQHGHARRDIAETVEIFGPQAKLLEEKLFELMPESECEIAEERTQSLIDKGISKQVAQRISVLKALYPAPDIGSVAAETGRDPLLVSACYFHLAERLGLGWLRRQIDGLDVDTRWHALARNALRDDLYQRQRQIVQNAFHGAPKNANRDAVLDRWFIKNQRHADHLCKLITELRTSDKADYLTLSVVLRELARLAG